MVIPNEYSSPMVRVQQTLYGVPVAQLVEHRAAMREVVSSTLAGPTLRVFK